MKTKKKEFLFTFRLPTWYLNAYGGPDEIQIVATSLVGAQKQLEEQGYSPGVPYYAPDLSH